MLGPRLQRVAAGADLHGRWFTDGVGRWWRVWACDDHLEGLRGIRLRSPYKEFRFNP